MKKVIVSLVVGESYERAWRTVSEASWAAYARRQGYDLLIFREPIDKANPTGRKIHWQKLLALSGPEARRYDRAVWVDSDIIVNERAPCIVADVPEDKIGVALVGEQQHSAHDAALLRARMAAWFGWDEKSAPWANYFGRVGLPEISDQRFNTGVLVTTPARHGDFLRMVYDKYPRGSVDFEQTHLSYEMLANGLHAVLDGRFNVDCGAEVMLAYPFLFEIDQTAPATRLSAPMLELVALCAANIFERSWFLHLCGGSRWYGEALVERLGLRDTYAHRDLRAAIEKRLAR